ncbi:MAG TPA: metalloregulator ArsR/SmtB family transcription factor [Candidatus Wallbacteria bacterium]|nr:MAG: putative HTH-type transcriptional regulator [bacterium ADurb.Bin243]HOD39384.1 metalloregulator ArsR/SmtB family transcription factor [Candidatus Wallbacteria bacterium]HOT74735.1 metalloregulator ArsR/SmtB family transcription factor [Candidatus Wallbacteria bacterium]HPG59618.1 metalloregulator ArsR/SmtB family transcription factor [Candidatus Wallbacteria bacterium]
MAEFKKTDFVKISNCLKAIAHPIRIQIIEHLRKKEMNVTELIKATKVKQANLSQHLSQLRGKEIVNTRKEGNIVFYSLKKHEVTEIIDLMRKYVCKSK